MISQLKLIELVNDNIKETQVEGFICVGHGINFKVYGVEVPFSLIELLGVKYEELYWDSGNTDNGYPRMVNGCWGASTDTLYYLTLEKYNSLRDSLG